MRKCNKKFCDFGAIFWINPCTIVQGLLPDFGVTLKIHKKSNFDRNQFKLETQHKYMYMYQEKIYKLRILNFYFWQNLARDHVL